MIFFFKENIIFFVWFIKDIDGINLDIIFYELNVDFTFKFINYKRCKLGLESITKVNGEVYILLKVGLIFAR